MPKKVRCDGFAEAWIYTLRRLHHEKNCMSDSFFVDTNILVYAHDRSAGRKFKRAAEIVEELWESGQGVVSTQVLQELCVSLRKRIHPPLEVSEIRALLQDFLKWKVVINSADSVLNALDFEMRYGINFWDALIVNAAEEGGCEVLYTEDLSAGQHYGSVQVVNPFK